MGYRFFRYTKDDGSGNPIFYNRDGTQLAIMEKGTNLITVMGGGITGDDLILKANSTDTYPYITLTGGASIVLNTGTNFEVSLSEAGVTYARFVEAGELKIGTFANRNIFLDPNGTGKVKFGTYTAGAATDSTGYIPIVDSGGTTRKLMVQA